ncbi:MAG: hypothetical protein RJB26_2186 [Pseudomonadota bacterium]
MSREARRRFAAAALCALLLLHLGAFAVYLLNESQFAFLEHWRDGREAWRAGKLDLAATELRRFANDYHKATRPFLVRRDFPAEAQAWAALGEAEQARGRPKMAADAFHRAALLGQASAWRERHVLLWTMGDAKELEAQGRHRIGDDNPEARQDLAAAALLRGDRKAALQQYQAALQELPRWLEHQHRPRRAADGGLVDEQLALYLLAGTTAWLAGDETLATRYCALLAAAQDTENPMDGLCRAAAAIHHDKPADALAILDNTAVASGEQASFAREIRQSASRRVPVPQSASPSPARAGRPLR